jgi:hypothetical protein
VPGDSEKVRSGAQFSENIVNRRLKVIFRLAH